MDRKRLLPPPAQAAEDGSGSQVAKRWRRLLVQEISNRVDFREVIAELLQRLPVELEEVTRRVVQEELQLIAKHIPLSSRLLTNQDKEIKYCLHFQNTLGPELFTYSRIVAADNTKLRIAIMDSNLREVITSDPWSSVKVEIVVVQGDFGGDDKKVWTKEEFKACVVSQRKDKGPLLTGQLEIKLTNGIGYLASAKFTDNSSWTRNQKFRLAVILSPSEHIEERVLEGISKPFRVKDRRVEANQKHHPPSLTDEVWRLECIRKNGVFHNRLGKGGIHNVQQFLQALTVGPERLRRLLGDEASKKGISDKTWDAIIAHAKECHQGEDLYSYILAGQHMGDLSASPQNSVDDRKRLASKNPKLPSPLAAMNVTSIPESSSLDPQVPYHCNIHQDEATTQVGSCCQPNAQYYERYHDSHSVQEYSSFQETNISNDLSNQMGGLPIGSIPMLSTTAIVTPIREPSPQVPLYPTHYDERADHGDFQGLCQDSYDVIPILQDPSIQMGGLPIGSIPMLSTTVIVTPIRQPSPQVPLYPAHHDEPADHGDFQGLCQESYDEQGIHPLQQPVSLQTNRFRTIGIPDEDLFGTRSGSSAMYRNMDDDNFDFSAMCISFSPRHYVRTYRKWIRLRNFLRFWISMSKHKRLAEG